MDEIENFHGCYLLCSCNPKHKGKTYIGYTVDPNKRINQHNSGLKGGGAWRTDGRGPWDMVLITHGFPNNISALRFEWAWQHPHKSRRLRHLSKKQRNESALQYCIRILLEMLRIGPWNRLPLVIRKMNEKYDLNIPVDRSPPLHMAIISGPLKTCKMMEDEISNNAEMTNNNCFTCKQVIEKDDKKVNCLVPKCKSSYHIICLAKHFLGSSENLLPISGFCPNCNQELLWGDIIRFSQGCYKKLNVEMNSP